MIKYTLMIFLIVHILCDFYFQTEKMAAKKAADFRWVLYHLIVYASVASMLFIIFLPGLEWKYVFCFALFHGIIDIVKFCLCKYFGGTVKFLQKKEKVFLLDQAAHIMAILIIVYGMRELDIRNLYRVNVGVFISTFGISELVFLTWLVKLLLIHKPVNVLISSILALYRPAENRQNINGRNAGRYIGTLERIIMTILISLGQYSAVGLVLTAKSIARYDRITKEQDFAEYYLLGTLLSTICAICISIIF